jgi:hypothetical protein
MLMQNQDYNPYVHFKSSLLDDWCMFIEFQPLINILLIKLAILIHKYFCQIDDNVFVAFEYSTILKVHKDPKNEPT